MLDSKKRCVNLLITKCLLHCTFSSQFSQCSRQLSHFILGVSNCTWLGEDVMPSCLPTVTATMVRRTNAFRVRKPLTSSLVMFCTLFLALLDLFCIPCRSSWKRSRGTWFSPLLWVMSTKISRTCSRTLTVVAVCPCIPESYWGVLLLTFSNLLEQEKVFFFRSKLIFQCN